MIADRRRAWDRGEPLSHPTLSWQGIVAAGVVSIGLLFLLTSLWNAIAYSSNVAWFADNIAWLNAATAIVSLLIAGLLAGFFARRSVIAGLMNGLTVWGLLVAGAVVFGVGSALPLSLLSLASRQVTDAQPGSFWPTVAAYGIGLAAAVVGGILGSFIPQRSSTNEDVIDLREPAPATYASAEQHYGAEASSSMGTRRETRYEAPDERREVPERRYESAAQRDLADERRYESPEPRYESAEGRDVADERPFETREGRWATPDDPYDSPERRSESAEGARPVDPNERDLFQSEPRQTRDRR